jgi:[amino group carrier protein]-L-2-aminoadipate 6-kinase
MLVVKIGGSEGINLDYICDDLAFLVKEKKLPLVVVHGGSHETNIVAEQLGHPAQFLTSASGFTSRRTDRRTLEIFEMVYCGMINKAFVERMLIRGVNAVGLSGLDGRIWEGERKKALTVLDDKGRRRVIRDDYTGKVDKVNTRLLLSLLEAGFLPLLTPPAASYEGEAINVDGDRAAAMTASALGADTLIILSNVPGLMANFPDESSLIRHIPTERIASFFDVAKDRMKKKVLGAQEAIQNGVRRIVFADGRVEQPVQKALANQGTVIGELNPPQGGPQK